MSTDANDDASVKLTTKNLANVMLYAGERAAAVDGSLAAWIEAYAVPDAAARPRGCPGAHGVGEAPALPSSFANHMASKPGRTRVPSRKAAVQSDCA